MKIINKSGYCLAVLLVLLACFTEDTEARRRVLRGRRTITRTYNRGLGIPAWAIIILTCLFEIIFGVLFYFGMRKWIISPSYESEFGNTYAPARQEEV